MAAKAIIVANMSSEKLLFDLVDGRFHVVLVDLGLEGGAQLG